jgi:manganese/zinc/iron transport system ATP- binding protein
MRGLRMKSHENAVLKIKGLTISYDRDPVLSDVSVTVAGGRIVGIIGPNGAGKSTLIKGALGLVPIDSGGVEFFGHGLDSVRQRVVYVPQRSEVDWDFPVTVEDVVLMGRYGRLGLFGRPSRNDRAIANEAIDKMGISSLAKRQISALSGGQQQRVFLARALAQEGELVFMDEPFVGVDAATEDAIVALLHEMRDKGKTVVIVNHDLQTAQAYFDDLLLLNKEVIAYGPSSEVFTPELLTETYGGRLAVIEGSTNQLLVAA